MDPEILRQQILQSPQLLTQLQSTQPELAEAAQNDPERFAQLVKQISAQKYEIEREQRERLARINTDPFDVEAQRELEEMIRQERIAQTLQQAIEHTPEMFGRVTMLYVDVEVNGQKLKAFVDTGAQATIMSESCARSCNLLALVDKRFSGVAHGVGTTDILGRVHMAQMKFGTSFLPCSFTIIKSDNIEILLGLDMLKRHQAVVDLQNNKLRMSDSEVPFLSEAELPESGKVLWSGEQVDNTAQGAAEPTAAANAAAAATMRATASISGRESTNGSHTGDVQSTDEQSKKEKIEKLKPFGFSDETAAEALAQFNDNVKDVIKNYFQD